MLQLLKKITASLFLLFIAGCTIFDGQNKLIASSPSFIALQVQTGSENLKWSDAVAKRHCESMDKELILFPYTDLSFYRELTYYCVNREDASYIYGLIERLGADQWFVYMRNTYGGVPSSLQRFGTAITPLSNMANTPQPSTSSPRQATQIPCIKTGERIDGFFKICQYSCGGTPVTATVRSHEICQPQRSF